MLKHLGSLFFLFLLVFPVFAQNLEELNIHIISENEKQVEDLAFFENLIKEEIKILLANQKEVAFTTEYCNCATDKLQPLFDKAFSDPQIDMIIAVGAMPSAVLAQQSTFSKPAIASIIIDYELQNLPITAEGTSGVNNFAYVQSPFSFKNDLEILYEIYPFKNVGIISSGDVNQLFPNFNALFDKATINLTTKYTQVIAKSDAATTLNAIPSDVDAVYVFPLFDELGESEEGAFYNQLAEKKLPSVSLLGESMVEKGAMVAYKSDANIAKIPRRIALNIAKIVKGTNASELPVKINTFSETVVINMNTVRKVGTYPNWDLMTEAILLNNNVSETERKLSLQTAILEALDKNLTLKIAEKTPILAQKDVQLAKTEFLPQLNANSAVSLLDPNTAEGSFGTRGRVNWSVGSSLSQLVYSEPAIANLAIQKLLQEGEENGLQVTQLDVVLDAASAFLSVLQAKSFMDIQSSNVGVTLKNLDIAKAKDAVGYSGATDLNRWKSELALNKIDLNDAQTQFRQAKYRDQPNIESSNKR